MNDDYLPLVLVSAVLAADALLELVRRPSAAQPPPVGLTSCSSYPQQPQPLCFYRKKWVSNESSKRFENSPVLFKK